MFALVDCNNFFVSCERVFRPDLLNKPVAVLSNNDGCIISRSEEVKALGIPMGAPVFKYKDIIEKNNVVLFSPNFTLYGDMSNRVMCLLADKCPQIEIYSIDEAFLDLSGMYLNNSYENYGLELKKYIYRCTGIPISIGFAKTKVLAKAANRYAKKNSELTKGVFVVDTPEKHNKLLEWIDVGDIWGIGQQYTKLLNSVGVSKGIDFVHLSDEWIQKKMTISGLKIKYELLGISCLRLEEIKDKKSISVSRSFSEELKTLPEFKERICLFAEIAAEKLRRQNSVCLNIMIYYHTNYFKKSIPPVYNQICGTLPYYTNSSTEIAKFSAFLAEKIFKENVPIKKTGIVLTNIRSNKEFNLTIFQYNSEKAKKIMKSIDEINNRYGAFTVHLASHEKDIRLKTLHQNLSPNYTTKWDDIIRVKI
ncbi:MAG: Y-family DNA polymerase [Bacteroidales bacterium]|nr:Y-family DNA polymerase [Bacteroidales bacterium]